MDKGVDTIEIRVVASPAMGNVSVQDFVSEVTAIHDALTAIAEDLHPKEKLIWKVVDLHHSDAVVVLGNDAPEQMNPVVRALFDGISRLASGEDAENFGNAAIEAIRTALRPIGSTVNGLYLNWSDVSATLDIGLKRAFERVSFKNEFYVEEWEGLLELVNAHAEKPTCRLYPISGPKWITCEFPKGEVLTLRDALTKKVSIYGKAEYRPREPFPHKILAEKLTVIEHDNDDLISLTGIFSSERESIFEQLQQVRDGWGK